MPRIDFQAEKTLIRAFFEELDRAVPSESESVLTRYCAPDLLCRAMHPFNEMTGAEEIAKKFWEPLKSAIRPLQRRMDVFFAGLNETDGYSATWVSAMGHLMGLFDAPWLGIRPTGKLVMLRFAEFHKVEHGQITESALFFDIPHLMVQAGLRPFPVQTAAHLVQPGPRTHDGLLFGNYPSEEGKKTLEVINGMVRQLGQWNSGLSIEDELAQSWADDMLWWGPAGIGATYTIERYAKQHAGAFRAAFAERSKTKHLCRMAEGHYGGFFGWPNFTAEHRGGFMGMPATPGRGEFRVVDIYRRRSDKLAENWVFIDLLHFWNQLGVDILGRTTKDPRC